MNCDWLRRSTDSIVPRLGTVIALLCLTLFFSRSLQAENSQSSNGSSQIALVLEGGGALGFAHVGVLKVLEEERIPVHFIAGTSMGSIVGAAYASGRTIPELEAIIGETDWDALFNESAPRRMVQYRRKSGRESELYGDAKIGIKDGDFVTPNAFVEGQYIELLSQRMFGKSDPHGSFDDLPIPFRAVAADIATGQAVVIDRGSLAQAARASMSVPGFFTPVEIDGKLLVDGGITNNFPVDVALAMGADHIIAVKLDTKLRGKEELDGPLAISAQILDLLLRQTSQKGLDLLRESDVTIRPDIAEYSSTSFKEAAAIMKAGEEAARALLPALREFSLSQKEFEDYQQKRTGGEEYLPVIDFVRVIGVEPHRARRIENLFEEGLGKPLSRDFVEERIRDEYQSGEYQKIGYEIETVEGRQGLLVNTQEKEWLENYLRFGFSIEDDFDGSSFYSLAVNALLNDLNTWGAHTDLQLEIGRAPRLFGEFYQPLGEDGWFFIAPEFSLQRRQLSVRNGDDEVARYFRETALVGLKGGVSLGRYGEFVTGILRGPGRLERDIGDASLSEFDYDIGEYFARFVVDQLDSPDFPTEGYRFAVSGIASRDALGASDDYQQTRIFASKPFTVGQTTLLLNGEGGFSSDDVPVEQSFGLGGMFDISGFEQSSLTADNYWIGRSLLFYRFLKGDSSLFTFGGYLGASLEYASLRTQIEQIGDYPDIVAGSVFVGVDTPILPVYLSFGIADESEKAIYLTVGRLNASRR